MKNTELAVIPNIWHWIELFCGMQKVEVLSAWLKCYCNIQIIEVAEKKMIQLLIDNKSIGHIDYTAFINRSYELYFNSKNQLCGIEIGEVCIRRLNA